MHKTLILPIPFTQFMAMKFYTLPIHLKSRALNLIGPRKPYPTPTKIDDPLAWDIVKLVQVKHHILNWKTTPTSITKRITHITQNLCPPFVDKALQDQYLLLGHQFGTELSKATLAHLSYQEKLLTEHLSPM